MHPLTPFVRRRQSAPYTARGSDFDWRARVVPVRTKTGIVASRRGGIAHFEAGVAAIFYDGCAQFGARFLCGGGSTDVAILPNADAYGGVCERCEDAAKGPCVYRCFNAGQELLYVGSTESRLKRLSSHRTQTTWWGEVAEVRAEHFPTIFQARAAERLAIIAEKPLRNNAPGNRRRTA